MTNPSRIGLALAVMITAGLLNACGHRGNDDDAAASASDGAAGMAAASGTSGTSGTAGGAAAGSAGAGPATAAGPGTTTGTAGSAEVPAPDPASPPALLSSAVVSRAAGVVRERIVYGNAGLRIDGQVCRPDDARAHPLLMYQHAGFSGLQAEGQGAGLCTLMAARGYAVVMSAYRGEDGSDGTVEYCLGEVDDSLALLSIARTMPWAQPGRLGLVGVSHGGCITLRMLARGVSAQAAVSLAGPTDWTALWTVASARAAADPGDAEAVDFLTRADALLGPPATNPSAWAARSPLAEADALRGNAAPLLVLQGAADATVPVDQACALARALGGFEASHLPDDYVPTLRPARTTEPVPGCASPQPAWAGGDHPRRRNWAGDRQLVVYDRLGHDDTLQAGFALSDLVDFIEAKYPTTTP